MGSEFISILVVHVPAVSENHWTISRDNFDD